MNRNDTHGVGEDQRISQDQVNARNISFLELCRRKRDSHGFDEDLIGSSS